MPMITKHYPYSGTYYEIEAAGPSDMCFAYVDYSNGKKVAVRSFSTKEEAKTWAEEFIYDAASLDRMIADVSMRLTRKRYPDPSEQELALACLSVDAGIFSSGKACEVFYIERAYLMKHFMKKEEYFKILEEHVKLWSAFDT
jgi:hypothetical protein